MVELILKYLPGLRSIGPWLTKKGVLYSGLLGIAIALMLLLLNIYPQKAVLPGETAYPFWQIVYLFGFPIITIIVWFITTQVYLRSGSGTKIGLAYDGYKVDVRDWEKTREVLTQLFKSNKIKGKVSLRFIPESKTRTDEISDKFMKKYKFVILTTIHHSPSVSSEKSTEIPTKPFEKIQIKVASKPEFQEFLKTTFPPGLHITRKREGNLADILEAYANNLHDILLLFVGTLLYHSGKYEDAAVILRYLDSCLTNVIPIDQPPRHQIRFLDMTCRLAKTRFKFTDVPDHDQLNTIRQHAETAMCYFDEFPNVAILISRIRFLVDDLDGAIRLTERFESKVQEIKGQGSSVPDFVCAALHINIGFLSFLLSYWDKSYSAYKEVISDGTYKKLNWADLVTFIDYVDSLDRYDGICYLRFLYRKMSGQSVCNEIQKKAYDWAKADTSRSKLHGLLNRQYPKLLKEDQKKKDKRKKKSANKKHKRK